MQTGAGVTAAARSPTVGGCAFGSFWRRLVLRIGLDILRIASGFCCLGGDVRNPLRVSSLALALYEVLAVLIMLLFLVVLLLFLLLLRLFPFLCPLGVLDGDLDAAFGTRIFSFKPLLIMACLKLHSFPLVNSFTAVAPVADLLDADIIPSVVLDRFLLALIRLSLSLGLPLALCLGLRLGVSAITSRGAWGR